MQLEPFPGLRGSIEAAISAAEGGTHAIGFHRPAPRCPDRPGWRESRQGKQLSTTAKGPGGRRGQGFWLRADRVSHSRKRLFLALCCEPVPRCRVLPPPPKGPGDGREAAPFRPGQVTLPGPAGRHALYRQTNICRGHSDLHRGLRAPAAPALLGPPKYLRCRYPGASPGRPRCPDRPQWAP